MTYTRILAIIANLVIMAGYMFVAFKIAPNFKITYLYTKVGGILFFILCGMTHAMMAYYALNPEIHVDHTAWWYLLIHVTQAVAVWMFVYGLYREFIVERRAAWVNKERKEEE